jgi:hAT family C-terminal dimerisation region
MEKVWQNDLYILAILLHPYYRTSYFMKLQVLIKDQPFNWSSKLEELRDFWRAWKNSHTPPPSQQHEKVVRRQTQQLIHQPKYRTIHDMSTRILGEWSIDTSTSDEFEDYIKNPSESYTETPLKWWCSSTHQARWPILSNLAISIFSIPPMSAEVERVFSGSRRTIPWWRASLSPEMIEKIECLKQYFAKEREGL